MRMTQALFEVLIILTVIISVFVGMIWLQSSASLPSSDDTAEVEQ